MKKKERRKEKGKKCVKTTAPLMHIGAHKPLWPKKEKVCENNGTWANLKCMPQTDVH